MATSRRNKGFTIIELMLAMSFLAFILIFVVSATIQLLRTYNKGLAIKDINQSGRSITDQLSRDIQATKTVIVAPGANRICTDTVAYAWNPDGSTANKYPGGTPDIELVRIASPNYTLCKSPYPNIPTAGAAELLTTGIAVQTIHTVISTDQKLVQMRLDLATSGSNAPTDAGACAGDSTGQFCATASFATTIYTSN